MKNKNYYIWLTILYYLKKRNIGDKDLEFYSYKRATETQLSSTGKHPTECKNTIKGLNDNHGNWNSDPAEVQQLLVNYFQQIFTAEQVDNDGIDLVLQSYK